MVFKKMETKVKHKFKVGVGSVAVGAFFLVVSDAAVSGFLIDDEKPSPVAVSLPVAAPVATSAPVAASMPVAAPLAPAISAPVAASATYSVAKLPAAAPVVKQTGEILPLKVNEIYKGCDGVNFGEAVFVPARDSIVKTLNIVLPTTWKMSIGVGVDRFSPSKDVLGGQRKNWTDAVDRSISGTNYLATVDCQNHELIMEALFAPVPQVATQQVARLRLVHGEPLESQVSAWAKKDGWIVKWEVSKDWIVASDADFGVDFQAAIKSLAETMIQNGINLHVDIYDGNRTVLISQANKE